MFFIIDNQSAPNRTNYGRMDLKFDWHLDLNVRKALAKLWILRSIPEKIW